MLAARSNDRTGFRKPWINLRTQIFPRVRVTRDEVRRVIPARNAARCRRVRRERAKARPAPERDSVMRFKLLIERAYGVYSRLDLECWTNIRDEINLARTDKRTFRRGATSIKKPDGFRADSPAARGFVSPPR